MPDLSKIRAVLEGDDLNARLALLVDLKRAGRDAVPTETQDYLIDRAIRDFEDRMDHGQLYGAFYDLVYYSNKKFNRKEKLLSEIARAQLKLALTFHRLAFLPRLVLVSPDWELLKVYEAEGLQAMLDQGDAIMAGRRYSMMADSIEKLVESREDMQWQPSPEQRNKIHSLFQTKLDNLEKRERPCGYPESPESLISALIALEAPGIKEQGARILRKCLPHESVLGTLVLVRFMAKHRLPGTEEVLMKLIAAEPAGPIRDHYEVLVKALRSGTELPEYSADLTNAARERDDRTRKGEMDSLRSAQMMQLKILAAMAVGGIVITAAAGIWWWRWLKQRKTV